MSAENMSAADALAVLERCQAYVDDAACFPEQFKPGVVKRDQSEYIGARATFAALVAENEALRSFARWAISESSFQGCDLGGGEIQDKAESLGLIHGVEVSEPCSEENCICAECGLPATCYRFSPILSEPAP